MVCILCWLVVSMRDNNHSPFFKTFYCQKQWKKGPFKWTIIQLYRRHTFILRNHHQKMLDMWDSILQLWRLLLHNICTHKAIKFTTTSTVKMKVIQHINVKTYGYSKHVLKDFLNCLTYDILYLYSILCGVLLSTNKTNSMAIKNGIFWDIMPCGSCKNRRFGGTYRLLHQGDKNQWTRNNASCN
jgi:hypothetical protein